MTSSEDKARALGFWLCLALVVGNMIGSGIFLLPAQLAPYGWNAIFGWLFSIGGVLCVAYVFAKLAAAMPKAGGPYVFVQAAFGSVPAFAVMWSYWIATWVGNAAIAVAAISYLSLFAPALANAPGLGAAATIALLWSLTAINCASVRAAGGFQLVTTLIKLIPLIAVILISALVVGEGRQVAQLPFRTEDVSLAGITTAATLTLWALLGVEAAAVGEDKVRDPARNIPRATMIGILIVGAVYLLVSTPVILLMPAEQAAASNAPLADFVALYWSPSLALLVALFAAVSAIGTINGWILLQGEMLLTMSRQGTFPRWFAKTSANGIAVRAQILSSSLASLLIAANYSRSIGGLFTFMALVSTAAALVLYLACSLAALRLQRTDRMAGSAVLTTIASLAALYAIWTLYGAGAEAVAWGIVLIAAGFPIYLLTIRANRSSPAAEANPAAFQE